MKHFLTLILLLTTSTFLIAQTNSVTLNYETDKSDLSLEHLNKLEQLIENINFDKIGLINISGHTDTVASKAYNVTLSLKRASKVENYFLSKGLDQSLITKNWFGENNAKSPSDLLKDRRVTIELFYQIEKPKESVSFTTVNKPDITIPDISDFFVRSKNPVQEFCIPFNKDTLIRGEKGTIIQIKAGSFNLSQKQRSSKSCIQFQLKEVFLKSEMILENLSTTSDGRILETQGMIYTNAMIGEDTLVLIRDIVILLPTDTIMPNAGVFDGERDSHSDVMNWTVDNNSVLRDFTVVELADCSEYNKNYNQLLEDRNDCADCDCDTMIWTDPVRQRRACIKKLKKDIEKEFKCGNQRCKVLFCRAKRLPKSIKGAFNKNVRQENKDFRACQRLLKQQNQRYRKKRRDKAINNIPRNFIRKKALKGKVEMTEREKEIFEITELIKKSDALIKKGVEASITKQVISPCAKLDSLFQSYDVSNTDELIIALNKPLMDEFGVYTMEELLDTLPKSNFGEIEIAYKNKEISFQDFKYYIFNSSALGWKNIDVFAKMSKEDLVKVKISVPPSRQVDFKLVFVDRQFVIPAALDENYYYFKNMPRGEEAWIVGLKYLNETPLLAMKSITIEENNFTVNFEKLTLDELKEKLKVLDFEE